VGLLEVLERLGPWTPLGVWLGAVLVAVLAGVLLRVRARLRATSLSLASLEDELRDAIRAVRESGAAATGGSAAIARRQDTGIHDLDLTPGTDDRDRLVRWVAAGQELVSLVRTALRDYDRLRQEGEAARRECQRLRLELVRLQAEHDRLLRERRQLAQALATFVHEAGPRALLDSPPPPVHDPDSRPDLRDA
jgi:hypothetical protein